MDSLDYIFALAALAYIVTSTMFAAVRWWHTCPTLDKNYAYPDCQMSKSELAFQLSRLQASRFQVISNNDKTK